MKKLLMTGAAFAVATILMQANPAHALSENANAGCAKLAVQIVTRYEQLEDFRANECPGIKVEASRQETSEAVMNCVMAGVMIRNRMRALPDLDKPSLEVRRGIAMGCVMLIAEWSEPRAALLADALFKN